ncbi:hypothetical protein EB796_006127 [Bugula neritina]|uniref:Fringe-like glycosyltransferase domain-containing protein n=1 Tax=Bugula neritina TaxID=10212 RepID=A0A7J7KBC4_BUGNE|nr:hypothetical protein EB796_006127 [Bugula neritina]
MAGSVDDDNYVLVPNLVKTLRKYDHTEDWYIGKPSLSHKYSTIESTGIQVLLYTPSLLTFLVYSISSQLPVYAIPSNLPVYAIPSNLPGLLHLFSTSSVLHPF